MTNNNINTSDYIQHVHDAAQNGGIEAMAVARRAIGGAGYIEWTTNYFSTEQSVFFFREPEHFDFFESDILPWMVKEHTAKNCNDFRIWCAATSSGEEPYSLMITLLEYFGTDYEKWNGGMATAPT